MLAGIVFVFGIAAWLVQIWLTKRDRWFSVEQMLKHHTHGLPMKWHFGIMWGDPFFLTPLATVLVWSWQVSDSLWEKLFLAAVALGLSGGMHVQYLKDRIENSHMHDGRFTPATTVHFVYMWVFIYIVLHTYLVESHENAALLIATSAVLFVHVVLGTHLIVKLLKPKWFTPGQPTADPTTLAVWMGTAAGLTALSWINLTYIS
jgi:hypothetical protein